jgi:Zn-finger nucleic acid-binding protein
MPTETIQCPRCHIGLFEGQLGPATLLGCGTCGGVWLDNLACQSLVQGASDSLTVLAEQAARHSTVVANDGEAGCPVCARRLTRTSVPPTLVTIDTCAAHGTWFDANELRVIALAYSSSPPPIRFPADAGGRHALTWGRESASLFAKEDGWRSTFADDLWNEALGSFLEALVDTAQDGAGDPAPVETGADGGGNDGFGS